MAITKMKLYNILLTATTLATITTAFVCDLPTSGCKNGMFNQATCSCDCIKPFCPDSQGQCTIAGGSCDPDPWLDCEQGVNCPWWVNPNEAEACTTGPLVPAGLWSIYNTKAVCCQANFPYSEACGAAAALAMQPPTKHPTVSRPEDDTFEVVPIKFEVIGLPEGIDRRELQAEMLIVLKRILLRLSDRIQGLKISSVEEKTAITRYLMSEGVEDEDKPAASLRQRFLQEEDVVSFYYNIFVVRDDDKKFGPLIIQEMRDSYEEILEQIQTFSDIQFFSGGDLNLNWCAFQNGKYDLCVQDTKSPPATGTCGGGNVGNGICPNPFECCSHNGFCGTTLKHCMNKDDLLGLDNNEDSSISISPVNIPFLCDIPVTGCINGLFNVEKCECECIEPYCPDEIFGLCTNPTGACGGNPWEDCTRGVNCPWWPNPLQMESCTTGPQVPIDTWEIYHTRDECCNSKFPKSDICNPFTEEGQMNEPLVPPIITELLVPKDLFYCASTITELKDKCVDGVPEGARPCSRDGSECEVGQGCYVNACDPIVAWDDIKDMPSVDSLSEELDSLEEAISVLEGLLGDQEFSEEIFFRFNFFCGLTEEEIDGGDCDSATPCPFGDECAPGFGCFEVSHCNNNPFGFSGLEGDGTAGDGPNLDLFGNSFRSCSTSEEAFDGDCDSAILCTSSDECQPGQGCFEFSYLRCNTHPLGSLFGGLFEDSTLPTPPVVADPATISIDDATSSPLHVAGSNNATEAFGNAATSHVPSPTNLFANTTLSSFPATSPNNNETGPSNETAALIGNMTTSLVVGPGNATIATVGNATSPVATPIASKQPLLSKKDTLAPSPEPVPSPSNASDGFFSELDDLFKEEEPDYAASTVLDNTISVSGVLLVTTCVVAWAV